MATVPVPPYYRLAGQAAWSPDGARLALLADGYGRRDQVGHWLRTLERTDAGTWIVGPDVAATVPEGIFLGWQTGDRFLLYTRYVGDPAITPASILAVDLDGSAITDLSRPEVEQRSDMNPAALQLAYNLLPTGRYGPPAHPTGGHGPRGYRSPPPLS